MTWTYNAAGIGNSTLFQVRRTFGDTNSTRQQLQDEEIAYAIASTDSVTSAAAVCCDYLVAEYAFQMDTQNGSLRIQAEKRMQHYMDLADRLRQGGDGDVPGDTRVIAATMHVGGASLDEKEAFAADTDNVQPSARIGQDDHPGTQAPSILEFIASA